MACQTCQLVTSRFGRGAHTVADSRAYPHRGAGLDSRLVRRRGGAFAPGAPPFATSLRSKCDLIAAILNPNRSFSATPAHESEIASEFALVFNKFAGTIACKGALQAMGNGANGEPARVVRGGYHGKTDSREGE